MVMVLGLARCSHGLVGLAVQGQSGGTDYSQRTGQSLVVGSDLNLSAAHQIQFADLPESVVADLAKCSGNPAAAAVVVVVVGTSAEICSLDAYIALGFVVAAAVAGPAGRQIGVALVGLA